MVRNIVVLSGNSHPELVQSICSHLGVPSCNRLLNKFSSGESRCEIYDSVRGKDVYIIQTSYATEADSVNDHLIELCIMISACKIGSARRITAVLPFFPYSRQPDVPYNRSGAPLSRHSLASGENSRRDYTFESFPPTPGYGVSRGASPFDGLSQNLARTSIGVTPASSSLDLPHEDRAESLLTSTLGQQLSTRTLRGGSSRSSLVGRGITGDVSPNGGNSSKRNSAPLTLVSAAHVGEPNATPAANGTGNPPVPVSDVPNGGLVTSSRPESIVGGGSTSGVASAGDSNFPSNPGYRQWVAQPGTLVAGLIECAGADHVVTMDLHTSVYQGFFDVPVDNLYGKSILKRYIQQNIPYYQDAVIVSPDAGGAKRATSIAHSLDMGFALIHKERRPMRYSEIRGALPDRMTDSAVAAMILVGDVQNRACIILDDIVDTANTITRAARLLKREGATTVCALLTHGVFSGDAISRVNASELDRVIVTNTVPQSSHVNASPKIEVLDVAPLFSEAIRRSHHGESLSVLFPY